MFKNLNKKALFIGVIIIAVLAVVFLYKSNGVFESQKTMDSAGSVMGKGELTMTNSLAMAPMADRAVDGYGGGAYAEESAVDMDESASSVERKLEKRVSLNLVIDNKSDFLNKLKELTDFYGGYWQGFYDNNYEYNPTVSVDIKIPVEQLDHFLAEVKGAADYIESENLTVNDVTLEYVDLKSRLENAEREEEQYLEVLEQAYKVEDILKVTEYLNNVRERIEVMQGQMNYLMNRTDFAVVSLYARILQQGQSVEEAWSLTQTWKEAVNDLIENTKYFIENSLYWLVTNILGIVFWGFIALIAYIVYRKKFKK